MRSNIGELGSLSQVRPVVRGGLVVQLGRLDELKSRDAPEGGFMFELSQAKIFTVVLFRTIWIGMARKSSEKFGDFSVSISQTGRLSTDASNLTVLVLAGLFEGQRGRPVLPSRPSLPSRPFGEDEYLVLVYGLKFDEFRTGILSFSPVF